jgi:hypothetical protein
MESKMSASNQTVKALAEVILRHVSRDTADKIVNDLLEIPGNKSFRDTIAMLVRELQTQSVDETRKDP